jgi:hypothetical protein
VNVTARQMDALRAIDAETGLKARRAEAVTLFGVDPATVSAGSLSLFGSRFRVADEPGLEIACDEGDVEEISRWVRDARKRADLVMISVHAHEPGPAPGLPPEFLREFAHRVIDEGADIVAGHGPHFLRGVELYREKPIFYGLGNAVSQIDLATLIPAEDYAKVPVPGQGPITPARFFAMRSRGDRILLGAHRKYWRTVVPVLTFNARRLIEARLYPVDLGYGEPVHRRGRPRLAARDEATDILETFAELSAPFQTKITIVDTGHGATGRLLLGDQPPA